MTVSQNRSSKLVMRVRFPSPAPQIVAIFRFTFCLVIGRRGLAISRGTEPEFYLINVNIRIKLG